MIKTRTYNSCSLDNCWDEIENEAEFCYRHCKLNNIHLEKLCAKFPPLDEWGEGLPSYSVVCKNCLVANEKDFNNCNWNILKKITKDIEII